MDSECLEKRFWARVDKTGDCWLWTGNDSNGHGRLRIRKNEREETGFGAEASAHLVVWWLIHHSREKFVDRTCGNTLCVRPEHLTVRTPDERFWGKVEKTNSCWVWRGARSTSGYGSAWYEGVPYAAHRLAWTLTNGKIDGKVVLRHCCDNPRCVNPSHLVPGTQLDNVRDMIDKGRKVVVRGERVATSKLTNEQVVVLRKARSAGMSLDDLSILVGMTRLNVYHAIKGKSYTDTK